MARATWRRDGSNALGRRGAAAAELAVVLPFLALLFVAVLDFARVYHLTQTLENCACAGALYASGTAKTPPSGGSPTDAAKSAACADGASLDPPLRPEKVTVTSDAATVTVSVEYEYQLLTPVLGASRTVLLKRTCTMNRAPVPGQ